MNSYDENEVEAYTGVPDFPDSAISYLHQDEYWRGSGGRRTRIADMDEHYRGNAANYLLDHAADYAQQFARAADAPMWISAPDGVAEQVDAEVAAATTNPRAWIVQTELYRALAEGIIIEGAPFQVIPYGHDEPVWIDPEKAEQQKYEEVAGVIELALKSVMLTDGYSSIEVLTTSEEYDRAERAELDVRREGDHYRLTLSEPETASQDGTLTDALADILDTVAGEMESPQGGMDEITERFLQRLGERGYEIKRKRDR